jgi:streptogramin lyase
VLAHPGIGIVMDSRGDVFYTDLKQVWRIAPDGTKSVAVPNVHTHELCLDSAGNLYGEHLWYEGDATKQWGHRVWRRSPDGKVVDIVPARKGFLTDYSFVRDRQGNMYWADRGEKSTAIRRRSADGAMTTLATAPFRDVRWMTVTPDGVVYLIDYHDLVRVAPDGSVATVARDLSERSRLQFQVDDRHALMGLFAAGDGSVYVADYAGRAVKKVSPKGPTSVAARTSGLWSPTGVMVAPSGDLWILEYSLSGSARVRRIAKNGSARVF